MSRSFQLTIWETESMVRSRHFSFLDCLFFSLHTKVWDSPNLSFDNMRIREMQFSLDKLPHNQLFYCLLRSLNKHSSSQIFFSSRSPILFPFSHQLRSIVAFASVCDVAWPRDITKQHCKATLQTEANTTIERDLFLSSWIRYLKEEILHSSKGAA